MSSGDRFSVDDPFSPRPPKKSSGGGWFFGIGGCIVAAVALPTLLVCGCCGGLVQWAMNERAKEIVAAVEKDETFREEIGKVSSSSINWSASMAAGDDVFVYDVTGDKGSGQLYVHEPGDDVESIDLHKGSKEWALEFDAESLSDWGNDPQVMSAIEGDPTIEKMLGTISKCEMNLTASMGEDDPNIFVYDVEGDKGSGQVLIEFNDDEDIVSAKLKKDGQEIDLKVDGEN
ncbi:hypothetical protein LOC68_00010 [Blastopirellula sp. JC732]|uniref:Uncharacterized protein n=1 Tax=Blastopirellula sediminis TaxID=2894196 RepID=A0A9X1MGS1_9BACT|nr:hypothetical protein [Blastopirellula sediminis]MCC9604258.1 hypothetical protein [Blastopirellula sediminis]MCC9626778.1 hypothetical protein [Blastopirellula sediminis]